MSFFSASPQLHPPPLLSILSTVAAGALLATSAAVPLYQHFQRRNLLTNEVMPRIREIGIVEAVVNRYGAAVSEDQRFLGLLCRDCCTSFSSSLRGSSNNIDGKENGEGSSNDPSYFSSRRKIVNTLIISLQNHQSEDIYSKNDKENDDGGAKTAENSHDHSSATHDLVVSIPFLLDVLAIALSAEVNVTTIQQLVGIINWAMARLLAMQLLFVTSGAVGTYSPTAHTTTTVNDDTTGEALLLGKFFDYCLKFAQNSDALRGDESICGENVVKAILSLDDVRGSSSPASLPPHSSDIFIACRNAILLESGKGSVVALSTFSALSEPIFVRFGNLYGEAASLHSQTAASSVPFLSVADLFHNSNLRHQMRLRCIFFSNRDSSSPSSSLLMGFVLPSVSRMQRLHRDQARREVIGRVWGNYTGISVIEEVKHKPSNANGRSDNRDNGENTLHRRRLVIRPPHRVRRVRLLGVASVIITAADTLLGAIIAAETVSSAMALGGGWLVGKPRSTPTKRDDIISRPHFESDPPTSAESEISLRAFAPRLFRWGKEWGHETLTSVLATTLSLSFAKVLLVYSHQYVVAQLTAEIESEMKYQRRMGMGALGSTFVQDAEERGSPWFHTEAVPSSTVGGSNASSRNSPNTQKNTSATVSQKDFAVSSSNFLNRCGMDCDLGLALAISMRSSVGVGGELSLLNWMAVNNRPQRSTKSFENSGGDISAPNAFIRPRAWCKLGSTSFALLSYSLSAMVRGSQMTHSSEKSPTLLSRDGAGGGQSILQMGDASVAPILEHLGNIGSVLAAIVGVTTISVAQLSRGISVSPSHGTARLVDSSGAIAVAMIGAALVTASRLLSTELLYMHAVDKLYALLNRIVIGSDIGGLFSEIFTLPIASASPFSSPSPLSFPSLPSMTFKTAFVRSIKGQVSFVGGSDWSKGSITGLADLSQRTMNTTNLFSLTAYRGEAILNLQRRGKHFLDEGAVPSSSADGGSSTTSAGSESDDEEGGSLVSSPTSSSILRSGARGTYIGGIGGSAESGFAAFDPQFPPRQTNNKEQANKMHRRRRGDESTVGSSTTALNASRRSPLISLPERMYTIDSILTDVAQSMVASGNSTTTCEFVGLALMASVLSKRHQRRDKDIDHPFISATCAPHLRCGTDANYPNLRHAKWLSDLSHHFTGIEGRFVTTSTAPLPAASALFLVDCLSKAAHLQRRIVCKLSHAHLRQPPKPTSKTKNDYNCGQSIGHGDDANGEEHAITQGFVSQLMNEYLDSDENLVLRPAPISQTPRRNYLSSLALGTNMFLYSGKHFISARILGLESYLVMRDLLGKQHGEDIEEKRSNEKYPSSRAQLLRRIWDVLLSHATFNQLKVEEAMRVGFFGVSAVVTLGISLSLSNRPDSDASPSSAVPPLLSLKSLFALSVFQSHLMKSILHIPHVYVSLHGSLPVTMTNGTAAGPTIARVFDSMTVSVAAFERVFAGQLFANAPRDGESISAISKTSRGAFNPSLKNGSPSRLKFDSDGKICGGFAMQKGIEYRSVSFEFGAHASHEAPLNHAVLKNVSATFAARQMTGIIGPSGSGKSTLVNLLLRYREPTPQLGPKGECCGIFLDDIPLEQFNIEYLRSMMVVINQSAGLIPGATMAEQIALFAAIASHPSNCGPLYEEDEHVKLVDVVIAAKMANCHDFIVSRPNGYNNVPVGGQGGASLSSGEIQRIVLARALLYLQLKSSKRGAVNDERGGIIILDEATNRLDAVNEAAFTTALNKLHSSRLVTIINISHRMSTLQTADSIVMIKEGMCVGQGQPSSLLEPLSSTEESGSNIYDEYTRLQTI